MSEKIFNYTTDIDEKIATASTAALGAKIYSATRLIKGVVNHVYLLETERGKVIARVFSRKKWPEDGKLQWIASKLAARGIDYARILHLSRGAKFFPYGFMMTEYIEGQDGWEAVRRGIITAENFFAQLGQLLRKVHAIGLEKFGTLQNGRYAQIADHLEELVRGDELQLKSDHEIDQSIFSGVYALIRKNCAQYARQLNPALTHGDPSPHNTRLTPDQRVVLVDWDSAESNAALRDIAALTYEGAHMDEFGDQDVLNNDLRSAFFSGYGYSGISEQSMREMERMFHIVQAVRLLTFHRFRKPSPDKFTGTWNYLLKLLRA